MSDKEHIEPRHATRGRDATREAAVEAFADANEESGFGRRAMIRNSLFAALVASIIPGITLFRGLAPQDTPDDPTRATRSACSATRCGKRACASPTTPTGTPIRAADVTLGSAVPRDPRRRSPTSATTTATSKRRPRRSCCSCACSPSSSPRPTTARTGRTTASSRTPRSARTSAAPSPSTSSRRTTCCAPATSRSSTWPNGAEVIFGPAARPLPQLPITVDDEGYLVARSDFTEPVGPSFWERH